MTSKLRTALVIALLGFSTLQASAANDGLDRRFFITNESNQTILSVRAGNAAYASCKTDFSDCDEVVVYACKDRYLGSQEFVGGSSLGYADNIALDKRLIALSQVHLYLVPGT